MRNEILVGTALILAAFAAGCDGGDLASADEAPQAADERGSEGDLRSRIEEIAAEPLGACEPVVGLADPMVPARSGCSMAHCDAQMSDNAGATPPMSPLTRILEHDTASAGTLPGLGCSSNGEVVACSLAGARRDALVVYDGDGARLGASGQHLGWFAWTSAPIVSEDGDVVAADRRHLVRFRPDPDGGELLVVWKVCLPGGVPISPVLRDDGLIVMASKYGPLAVHDSRDGALLAELTPEDETGVYDTLNTVSVRGDRLYLTAEARDDGSRGRLYAIDLVGGPAGLSLEVAWSLDFRGPSGASPLVIEDRIYTDGRTEDGRGVAIAARDLGSRGEWLWQRELSAAIPCSLARDPRGGVWTFATGRPELHRLAEADGAPVGEPLDLDAVLGTDEEADFFPGSVMTIAGDPSRPVMLVAAMAMDPTASTFVLAIDLASGRRLWRVRLGRSWLGDLTMAQYAIATDSAGRPRVVFPGFLSGAYFLGAPSR